MEIPPRDLNELQKFTDDNYVVPTYNPTPQIVKMHGYPRFGWTTQFSSVLSSDSDQRSNYLKGIIIGSLITLMIAIVWAIILVGLKCGGRRVGCASGVPRKPQKPTKAAAAAQSTKGGDDGDDDDGEEEMAHDEEEEVGAVNDDRVGVVGDAPVVQQSEEEYEESLARWRVAVRNFERRLVVSRVIFLLCGVCVIVASILFFVKGMGSLVHSLGDVQSSIGHTEGILDELHSTTVDFIKLGDEAQAERDTLANATDSFCGLDLLDDTDLGASDREVFERLNAVLEALAGTDDFLHESAVNLEGDLSEAMAMASDVNSGLDNAYPYLYCSAAVMAVLIILVLCLMIEVVMAWRGRKMRNCFFVCMKNAIILPIFFFVVILSWLFAVLFQLVAIGGSDFCIAPDSNVDAVVDTYGVEDKMSFVLFAYVTYYVRCRAEEKPSILPNGGQALYTAIAAMHDFVEYMSDNAGVVANVCGSEGADTIRDIASVLHSTVHTLNGLLIVTMNLLKCSTFNPIYVGVLHSGLCINGVSGLTWIFSTMLCIAICSMLMITFRAAREETEDDVNYLREVGSSGGGVDGGYEPYDPDKKVVDEQQEIEVPQDGEEPHGLSLKEEQPQQAQQQQELADNPQQPMADNPFDLSQPAPG